jgi:hypothetical protein
MSQTLQPSYWCIENLGDVDPLQHGGKFVCIDRRGVYAPIMLILQEPENKRGFAMKSNWSDALSFETVGAK